MIEYSLAVALFVFLTALWVLPSIIYFNIGFMMGYSKVSNHVAPYLDDSVPFPDNNYPRFSWFARYIIEHSKRIGESGRAD